MRRFLVLDVEYEVHQAAEEYGFTEKEAASSVVQDILGSIREVLPVVQVDIINEGQANIFESESSNLP